MDSVNTARRGSDDPFSTNKPLLKMGSIDLLLEEGDEEEDEEEEDSDQKEVIYFLPGEDGSESSDTIARLASDIGHARNF